MSGKNMNSDTSPNGGHNFFSKMRSGKPKEDPTLSLKENNARLEALVSMWKAKYAALENYCDLLEDQALPNRTISPARQPAPDAESEPKRRYFEYFLLLGAPGEELAKHASSNGSSPAGSAMVNAAKLFCFPSDPPLALLEEFAFPAGPPARAAHRQRCAPPPPHRG